VDSHPIFTGLVWHSGVAPDTPDRLAAWAGSAPVGAALAGARLTHGDPRTDQVFVTPDGYRVVDWQRPTVAPPEVDLAALLVAAHIDPLRHVTPAAVAMFWYLRLHWAVRAQHDFFPDFRGDLFILWATEAIGHILA
jgi:aminoglycoside phosphotransferase (APT) family kinase protein